MKIGFDNAEYLRRQSEKILERIQGFSKLYLEFGGKLFDDYHAARVLPGFEMNVKVRLLQTLKDKTEIIFCINASDIERNKIRADLGITYDLDLLRLIDSLRALSLTVSSIVITQFTDQPAAAVFANKLKMRGEKVYLHRPTAGYPTDVDTIVSDQGYGMNPYIETSRPLVVVTAPGPGSGKLGTCLSQLYHEYKRGNKAGYAKFETFPIWNIPLKHPVNLAYEAATADLKDCNMIDPFHLEAYGVTTVNYNRDIEIFPVVKRILEKITGTESIYRSPTDMGVNMAGYCIFDDEAVREAAKAEIIRRYFKICCDYKLGRVDQEAALRVELLMKEIGLRPEDRKAVPAALEKAEQTGTPSMALELPDGRIVTGKTTMLLNAGAALILNAVKAHCGIPDEVLLLSPEILTPILKLKMNILGERESVLGAEEVLLALSICAATDQRAERAMNALSALRDCEAHSSCMLHPADERVFRKLGVRMTCEAVFFSDRLYMD